MLAKVKFIFKWLIYILLSLVIILLVGIELFDRYASSEKGTRWLYEGFAPRPINILFTDSGLRYLSIGDAEKPALLLVHGAPGSCVDWRGFTQDEAIYDQYRLLIIDRPGYGGTQPSGAEKSIQTQAERILEVLESETQPAVILGHSYGGPIVMVMAALQPEKISRVIGVAGAYSPDHEVTFFISHFVKFGIFKYLLPRMLWVSNEEKLSHPAALRTIEHFYRQITVPVSIIHSTADTLVPYANAQYILQWLAPETEMVTLEGIAHPIQMNQPELLVDFVLGR